MDTPIKAHDELPPSGQDVLWWSQAWMIGYVSDVDGDSFNAGGYWHTITDETYWTPLPPEPLPLE